jgi:octaprenyl-diphosphate synthase
LRWLSAPRALFLSTSERLFLSANSSSTAAALALIAGEMRSMDEVIGRRLDSDVPLVSQVSQYIIAAGGKRLRPALLLLMCGALGYRDAQRFNLAAVVEFIHTATLLHDDVVDESTLRRGRSTANEVFGNPASVLVGDFLYSRAFQMMVEAGDMRIMQTLAEATNVIAEGEVLQLMNMHDAALSEEGYLLVIRSKTAKLFEASARLAALLAGSPPDIEKSCADYGQALGTAFQVIDDVLDYDGDVQVMGKNLGDDLREGKATLPLIVAMQRSSEADRRTIEQAIETGGTDRMDDIIAIVERTGALLATRQAAAAEAQRALDALRRLPQNIYSDALQQLASQLLERRA